MYNIDNQSRVPVWEQLAQCVEKYISLGILNEGDRLPSVRELTYMAGINPNTVQRAMNDLCTRQIIVSVSGKGSYVSKRAKEILLSEAIKRLPELSELCKELSSAGVSEEIIKKTVSDAINKK